MPTKIKREFAAYVDGSCKGNGTEKSSMAGGVRLVDLANGNQLEFSRSFGKGTSNQAELHAIYLALDRLICETNKENHKEIGLTIYSDSMYAIQTVTNQCKIKTNHSLIKHIQVMMQEFGYVEFKKVPAHSGHHGNSAADKLAAKGHLEKPAFSLEKEVTMTMTVRTPVWKALMALTEEVNSPVLKRGKKYRISYSIQEVID